MSEAELKLECAKLAAQLGAAGPEALTLARAIYDWVSGTQ